jgi:hypothetical protein
MMKAGLAGFIAMIPGWAVAASAGGVTTSSVANVTADDINKADAMIIENTLFIFLPHKLKNFSICFKAGEHANLN